LIPVPLGAARPWRIAACVAALVFSAPAARAASVTECTPSGLCYCINADFRDAIAEKVDYFRKAIAEQRTKGKAVGYLSVPLSTTGGGFFGVNREVAAKVKTRVEARLGANSAWVLDPTARDADLPMLNNVRAGQACR